MLLISEQNQEEEKGEFAFTATRLRLSGFSHLYSGKIDFVSTIVLLKEKIFKCESPTTLTKNDFILGIIGGGG